jgi:hypothetical protein
MLIGDVDTRTCEDMTAGWEHRHVRVQGHHADVQRLHALVKALHAAVQAHHARVKNASLASH